MTNQQGVPKALRLADALECRTTSWPDKVFAAAELRRPHAENERLAALVDAQQPAPSAAADSVCYDYAKLIAESMWATHYKADAPHWESCDSLIGVLFQISNMMCGLSRAPADSGVAPAGGLDDDVDAIALARYKVVPAHESMFHRFAVVAGDGKQQLYLGREVECENMARKFAGAFLDGAFYQSNIATTPPAQAYSVLEDAARLDWLALAGPVSICVVIDRPHDGEVEVSTDDVTGYGKTLREALDAARKQGEKP